jgi:hypothetical protein
MTLLAIFVQSILLHLQQVHMVTATQFGIAILQGYDTDPPAQKIQDRLGYNVSFDWVNKYLLGPLGHSMIPVIFFVHPCS